VLLLAVLLFGRLAWDGRLDRIEAAALLVAYAIYAVLLVQAERKHARPTSRSSGPAWRTPLAIGAGLVAVVLSAHLVVEQALVVAKEHGWDQTVVGVLLIGAGTSLPELALSLGAAAKGRAGLSVGNVIGSNVFDLLVPVGVGGLIHPLAVGPRRWRWTSPSWRWSRSWA
jgi:cation:H+ antiporter